MACKYQLGEDAVSEIANIIEQENLANHYYSAVNIFSKLPSFSFIPANEYQYGMEGDVIANSFPIYHHEIEMEICSEENLNIIHAYNKEFLDAFEGLKKEAQFRHLSLAYIQGLRKDGIYCNLLDESIIILVRKGGRFIFYNQFAVNQSDDYLYFTMLAFNQLNLDPNHFVLHLHGQEEKVVSFKLTVEEYVVNVREMVLGFTNMEEKMDLVDLFLAAVCE